MKSVLAPASEPGVAALLGERGINNTWLQEGDWIGYHAVNQLRGTETETASRDRGMYGGIHAETYVLRQQ